MVRIVIFYADEKHLEGLIYFIYLFIYFVKRMVIKMKNKEEEKSNV